MCGYGCAYVNVEIRGKIISKYICGTQNNICLYIFIFSSKTFKYLAWSSQQWVRLCVTHLRLIRERERPISHCLADGYSRVKQACDIKEKWKAKILSHKNLPHCWFSYISLTLAVIYSLMHTDSFSLFGHNECYSIEIIKCCCISTFGCIILIYNFTIWVLILSHLLVFSYKFHGITW